MGTPGVKTAVVFVGSQLATMSPRFALHLADRVELIRCLGHIVRLQGIRAPTLILRRRPSIEQPTAMRLISGNRRSRPPTPDAENTFAKVR